MQDLDAYGLWIVSQLGEDAMQDALLRGEEFRSEALDEALQRLRHLLRTTLREHAPSSAVAASSGSADLPPAASSAVAASSGLLQTRSSAVAASSGSAGLPPALVSAVATS